MMSTIAHRKELNILLLGRTGCGKSTFINALCNYFQYKTLDDALSKLNSLHIVIPSIYTWTKPDDESYKQVPVILGEHENECRAGVGVSATQWPREIIYNYGEHYTIRLIDTPGFGDTSGPDKDDINRDRILKFIDRFTHLDAICILFKPNETRNTSLFRYCFNKLFMHMHNNILKNIICVFTCTKGTNWLPGETLNLLRDTLQQIKKTQNRDCVNLELGFHNIVCFENDCFNFLGAVKMGVCDVSEKDDYAKSWEKSTNATRKLLEMVQSLQPHCMNELTLLYKVRKTSINLGKILKELNEKLEDQSMNVKRTSTQLEAAERNIKFYTEHAYPINNHDRQGQFILCCNNDCAMRDDLGNMFMCRNDSNPWGSFLKFDMLGTICRYCKCNMVYHSTFTRYTIKRKGINMKFVKLKDEEIEKKNRVNAQLLEYREDLCDLKFEKQLLNKILHQISIYISNNSILLPSNMSKQIKLEIESEKMKPIPSAEKIQRLKEDLETQDVLNNYLHKYEKQYYAACISKEKLDDILEILETLMNIGPKVQQLFATEEDNIYYETVIVNPASKPLLMLLRILIIIIIFYYHIYSYYINYS